jgi:hypothetical protein
MDLDKQKKFVETIKKCQRNWDKDYTIPANHIEHFIYLATNSPTKQHEAYFNLYVISNKNLLNELYEHTWGFTLPVNNDTPTSEVPCCARNPQMNASVYFLWTIKQPDTIRNFERDGTKKNIDHINRKNNAFTSVGISMGIVAFSAASLGYSTGFNKNHSKPNAEGYWNKSLSIPDNEEIAFGLGIGIGKKDYNWNETDEHELMIGWPDTFIVDINKVNSYNYNNKDYEIRKKIKYPAFSLKERNIQVVRFE